ncbi:MAG: oxygen-dependent coproporphyrinogen oxidase [Bacteroidetes bacterium]|nr:MAG: oxygen-dependent coproporphyrinogen oxidase [Bacteroidota bacterium]
MFRNEVTQFFQNLQMEICQSLEEADGKATFQADEWQREGGGGGVSRILQNGNVIEKGGVNFSAVEGAMPEALRQNPDFQSEEFYATGVSIVLHPHNPHVPIIHMNVRYFETDGGKRAWFGGGIDLTPHYIVAEDAQFFHQSLKNTCDRHNPSYYPAFKKWADDYFFIKHRQETRGVGGIFFDRLHTQDGFTMQQRFDFVQSVGKTFAPVYTHFMHKNKGLAYTDQEKQWQYVRRGRYVEFNLVYDAGTKFGLETAGRIESILMSLPPQASWVYNFQPTEGSREAQTLQQLVKGIDWVC